MKLKEAPKLEGKKFKEYYSNQVIPKGIRINLAIAVDPGIIKDREGFLKSPDEDTYVRDFSDFLNSLGEEMDENSVVLISGFWGKDPLDNDVNATWRAVMSSIKTSDYSIGDVLVWKKRSKTPHDRDNRLDTICEPVFVLGRKSEYRTYHMNVNVQTVRGNAVYHTPIYNLVTTEGKTPEEDHKELIEYLLRIYCPEGGRVYYPFEEKGDDVQ